MQRMQRILVMIRVMNRILKHLREHWLQYAMETIVVVNGVLIAFTLSNWNESRLERIEEKKILVNLKTEFQGNLQELNSILVLEARIIQATDSIYKAIDNNDFTHIDRLDSLLSFSFYNPSFDPKSGGLNNLLNSGKLELISNDSLRELLIAWPGIVADMKEEEELLRTHALSLYSPYIDNYVAIRNVIGYMSDNYRSFEFERNRTERPSDYKSIFSEKTFENLLSRRSITLQFCLTEGEAVKRTASTILRYVEEELRE